MFSKKKNLKNESSLGCFWSKSCCSDDFSDTPPLPTPRLCAFKLTLYITDHNFVILVLSLLIQFFVSLSHFQRLSSLFEGNGHDVWLLGESPGPNTEHSIL